MALLDPARYFQHRLRQLGARISVAKSRLRAGTATVAAILRVRVVRN
jgi:hypothetical protein